MSINKFQIGRSRDWWQGFERAEKRGKAELSFTRLVFLHPWQISAQSRNAGQLVDADAKKAKAVNTAYGHGMNWLWLILLDILHVAPTSRAIRDDGELSSRENKTWVLDMSKETTEM